MKKIRKRRKKIRPLGRREGERSVQKTVKVKQKAQRRSKQGKIDRRFWAGEWEERDQKGKEAEDCGTKRNTQDKSKDIKLQNYIKNTTEEHKLMFTQRSNCEDEYQHPTVRTSFVWSLNKHQQRIGGYKFVLWHNCKQFDYTKQEG